MISQTYVLPPPLPPQGVIPTAQRAAIVVGVELPVYDITKKHLLGSGVMGDTVLTHFMSVSCYFSWFFLTSCVDVIGVLLQLQLCLRPCGGARLQPGRRGADSDDEPEGFVWKPHLQRDPAWGDADVEERGLLCSV